MIEIYDKKSYNKIEINNSLMKMSESCKDHKKGISKMNYEAITSILNDGLVLATGCTEPGALALTAATAAAHLGEEVKYIHTFASGNIIKMLIPLVSRAPIWSASNMLLPSAQS